MIYRSSDENRGLHKQEIVTLLDPFLIYNHINLVQTISILNKIKLFDDKWSQA